MLQEIPQNLRYGYVRVSSKSQEFNSSIESQKEQLIRNGIPEENIRIEVASAADAIETRPVFQKLTEIELKGNSLLMVTKVDRCSRDTLSFLKLREKLHQKSIVFVSLDLPSSPDLATNKLIATTLVAIATFENDRRKERQRQGIRAAQKEGKYKGRKTVITKKLIEQVKHLKEDKGLSVTDIARLTGKARATIYKILKTKLNYQSNNLIKINTNEDL